ncbi:hypothetical protein H8356DRAFT_1625762 [Neocallimastix lanati (nom. inval.)]|jgi:hypothetical protein|nr:hypothetical protein H8356DRAFT_1625762 [Neocallimastix sp. JGI-2020a]
MSFSNHIQRSISCDNSNSCQKASTSEQLSSTAKVFCEAVNQIVKSYLVNYDENNIFQTINLSFAQKVIKKTKISFSQLVVTLVYLNRYYKYITSCKKHIPGHKESVIPTLSHVVILCIIQAERYITDIPHRLSWWANICAGQTKSVDINKWQRDFFDTINYKLYVHPEKDYNNFKFQIKRLASRLFENSVNMPTQFRRSINLGSQQTQSTSFSSQSSRIPSKSNIISEFNVKPSIQQTKVLLSPLYSGNSKVNPSIILGGKNNMVSSPLSKISNDSNFQNSSLNVPVLNITNTNLTTSPVEINDDNNMNNQTRTPTSIYINSQFDTRNQLNITSLLPPTQNPNNLMVNTNMVRSPIKKIVSTTSSSTSSLIALPNIESSTNSPSINVISNRTLTQSPSQYGINKINSTVQKTTLVNSPLDMTKTEEINTMKTTPRVIKRKRSFYDNFQIPSLAVHFLKAAQGVKRTKLAMTISPEEIDYQPVTPSYRPMEENNKKGSGCKLNLEFQNQKPFLKEDHKFCGDEHSFQSLDKGKNEDTSYQLSEESVSTNVVKNSFLNHLEAIPSSTTQNDRTYLIGNNNSVNNEEIIVSSLLLASNNTNTINLIPVSPPLTPI